MSDKITQEELDMIAKFLENNEVTELEDGAAEGALELEGRHIPFNCETDIRTDVANSTSWTAYKDRKGV